MRSEGRDRLPDEQAAWRGERLRRHVPGNEVGGAVITERLLCRSAEAAIQLEAIKVFSTGLQLRFELFNRPAPSLTPSELMPPWMENGQGGILVGVKLDDGRTALNVDQDRTMDPVEDESLTLALSGFSGSGDAESMQASVQYLLSPKPINQTLTIVVAWPKFGIPETALVIDAAEIDAGSSRLVTLWPVNEDRDWYRPPFAPGPPGAR